jgi:hypothetical protein
MAMATILSTARDGTLVVTSATKAVPTRRGNSEEIKPISVAEHTHHSVASKVRTNVNLRRMAISFAAIFGLTTLLAGGSVAKAQELTWAASAGGANPEHGYAIATDPSGDSYVTGLFTGQATFGAGEDNETVLEGEEGVFVAKYASDGALLWVTSASVASSDDQGLMDIATDADGNSYVTGSFFATATFGAGEANETVLEAGGSPQLFVAKYARDGTFLWVRTASGSGVQAFGSGIATDIGGNSYVTGFIFGTATFGAGEANETVLEAGPNFDMFVAKYAPNGSLLWVTNAWGERDVQGNESGFVYGHAIATDPFGTSYVTGVFVGMATFGAGEASETVLDGEGGVFVAKYARNGTLLWVRGAGDTSDDWGRDIATDFRGNSYVTGRYFDTATFGAGEANETVLEAGGELEVFVAKYASDGALLWARSGGGLGADFGNAIATDRRGSSYVTGHFLGTATFGAGEANETVLEAGAELEVFVAKYASDGALLWARSAGGADNDWGYGVATDSRGNSYVIGDFSGTATFGAGEAKETVLKAGGETDVFVANYRP